MARQPRQRRSEITRHRVIDAAIEAFGMEGFERTSTRALVERAGTNLVAIHYHFGNKDGVYRAAAEHIAAAIRERNEPVLERAQRVLDAPRVSRRALIECVCDVFDDFAGMVMAGGVPEGWRRFLLREQVEPTNTGAFEAIFDAIYPLWETMFRLIARLIGRPPDHPEVRLLTMMIFGQVSVFRTNRAWALRLLGWPRFGPAELRQIRAVSRAHIVTLLEGRAPRGRAAPPAPRPRRPRTQRPA